MFNRRLLESPNLLVEIGWFGLGSVRAVDRFTGAEAIFSPRLKTHMLEVIRTMKERRILVNDNPLLMAKIFEHYTRLAMDPNNLATRSILNQSPHDYATPLVQAIIQESSRGGP